MRDETGQLNGRPLSAGAPILQRDFSREARPSYDAEVGERIKSFWLPAGAIAYVCFAAAQMSGGWRPWLALVGLPLVLAAVWRYTGTTRHSEDRIEPAARTGLRACAWGAAMWVAARIGPPGVAAMDAAANLGTGAASVGALVALARVQSLGGALPTPAATRSLDAAGFSGLLWGIATAVALTRALLPSDVVVLDPLAIDYATTSAGVAGLLVLIAATWRLRILRQLEVGVGDRAAGALALAISAACVALPTAALDMAPPDRLLPLAVIVASLACAWTATTPEPTAVTSALRGFLAIMILGTPVVVVAAVVARQLPEHSGLITLSACAVAIGIGLVARAAARPLGPEQSRWLDAIESASQGALQPEPEAALRAALEALGRTTALPGSRPELWRNTPSEVLSVDVAGYLHVKKAEVPNELYELALEEPERTLRAEVLAALEVRRPEVRPILAWFQHRRAFSATVIVDEDGPIGFILLPRGNRASPMTLEETRALRLLADRISALLAVSSALARSRERELAAIARADAMDDERQRLEHIIQLGSGRNHETANREARRARSAAYSPAARLTLERLEKMARGGERAVLLEVPAGGDAIAWAAVYHLASPRSGGPFVVVDGASGLEHELERWKNNDESPLALADGGTLMVADAAALPPDVQAEIALYLSRWSEPKSGVLPAAVIMSATQAAPQSKAISGPLAKWFGAGAVQVPALADRAEDLRALVLEELARAGLRLRGEPLGVDIAALRQLVEHTWPGNELELRDVLTRAARLASAATVTLSDLSTAGFVPVTSGAEMLEPERPRRSRRPRPRRR